MITEQPSRTPVTPPDCRSAQLCLPRLCACPPRTLDAWLVWDPCDEFMRAITRRQHRVLLASKRGLPELIVLRGRLPVKPRIVGLWAQQTSWARQMALESA